MKKPAKKRTSDKSIKMLSLPLVYLLMSGCSYYGGKLSYFDLTDEEKKIPTRKQAEEKFWASVRPKSNLADALYRLGLHYQKTGNHEKAIGEFTKALQLDRNYCKAYNGLAMTYDLQQRCKSAHAVYEQALQCAPDQVYAYNNYACSSLLCGDYGKGLDLLHKAESLATDDTRIKNNLKIARTIAIHENISEYIQHEASPLPATAERATCAIPTPILPEGSPTQTETPAAKMAEVLALPENAMEISSAEQVSTNQPAEEQTAPPQPLLQPVPVAEVASENFDWPTAIVQPEITYSKDIVEQSENPAPGPAVSSPDPLKVGVEVSNGNGTTGMAKRSADFLRNQGFTVRSVTNAKHFRFEESTIYYRQEYLQTAKDLAAVIPGTQNLEQVETMEKTSIGVRVLLGRDLVSMRFPAGYTGLADSRRQPEQPENAIVLTASINLVHY